MCRHLAYLGPPVALSRWLFDAPHALMQQASAPRDMRGGGTINADGFGVGWFATETGDSGNSEDVGNPGVPLRYRADRPIWTDMDLRSLAANVVAGAALAAVRSATPGMPLLETASAPFVGPGTLFSLNGRVAGWPDSMASLAAELPVSELLTMEAPTDSVLLWSLVRQQLAAGAAVGDAVATVTEQVAAAAPGSRLNLLVTDQRSIAATAVTHSLWVQQGPASVLVSSEPLDDDPGWWPVSDGSLVVATIATVEVFSLAVASAGATRTSDR